MLNTVCGYQGLDELKLWNQNLLAELPIDVGYEDDNSSSADATCETNSWSLLTSRCRPFENKCKIHGKSRRLHKTNLIKAAKIVSEKSFNDGLKF